MNKMLTKKEMIARSCADRAWDRAVRDGQDPSLAARMAFKTAMKVPRKQSLLLGLQIG
jgi:hypothetical protein